MSSEHTLIICWLPSSLNICQPFFRWIHMGLLFPHFRYITFYVILLVTEYWPTSWSKRYIVFALAWIDIWCTDIITTIGYAVLVSRGTIHYLTELPISPSFLSTISAAFSTLLTIVSLTRCLTDADVCIIFIYCHRRNQRYQPTSLRFPICICPCWVLRELFLNWLHTHG